CLPGGSARGPPGGAELGAGWDPAVAEPEHAGGWAGGGPAGADHGGLSGLRPAAGSLLHRAAGAADERAVLLAVGAEADRGAGDAICGRSADVDPEREPGPGLAACRGGHRGWEPGARVQHVDGAIREARVLRELRWDHGPAVAERERLPVLPERVRGGD